MKADENSVHSAKCAVWPHSIKNVFARKACVVKKNLFRFFCECPRVFLRVFESLQFSADFQSANLRKHRLLWGNGTCNEFLRKCAQVQSWLGVGRALLVGRWTRAVFSLYIGVFWNCAMLQMVVSVPHALLPAQAAAIECTVTGPNVFIDKNFHDLSFLTNLTFSNLHCDAAWCCSLQSYLNKRLITFSLI